MHHPIQHFMHKSPYTKLVPRNSHALWDLCITTICIIRMSTVCPFEQFCPSQCWVHDFDVAKTFQDMTNTSFSITVWRALRGTWIKAVTKQNDLFSPRSTLAWGWTLQRHTKTRQWGTGKGLFSQMRPKSIIWGQTGRNECEKYQERD